MNSKVITKHLFWDDFSVGSIWTHGSYLVTEGEIIEFAERYDPLEIHTSPEQARNSPFGIFCASGIHTLAIAQRLFCDAILLQTNVVAGGGIDGLRMRSPVVPGNCLCLKVTVSSVWPHRTKANNGWTQFRNELSRQNGEVVLDYKLTTLLQRAKPTLSEPGIGSLC